MHKMTLIAAFKHYFGVRPGQTTADFMTEVRALTTADRDWFKANFASVGYDIQAS